VKRAESCADWPQSEAGFAIDYAIASVEQARLAVLHAVDGFACRPAQAKLDGSINELFSACRRFADTSC
jgi:hypothetical protein